MDRSRRVRANPGEPTVLCGYDIVGGWLAFAFTLLTNDRLIEDLTTTEARTAALNRELEAATWRATEAARRAALADEAKTDFLAHMSHEIRNPLSSVIVPVDLVLDGRVTVEKRPNFFQDRSRHLTVNSAPFDLAAEMAQIVDLFLPQAKAKIEINDSPFNVPSRAAALVSWRSDSRPADCFELHAERAEVHGWRRGQPPRRARTGWHKDRGE